MIRKLAAIITLVFALTAATAVSAADTGGLVVLGDSISTGYGLTDSIYECASYGNLLASYLGYSRETGTYINAAVNGDKSDDMLGVIETMKDDIAAASTIMFSIGGNDVLMPMLLAVVDATGIPESAGLQGAVAVLTNKSSVVDIEAVYASVADRLNDEAIFAEFLNKITNYKSNYEKIAARLRELNPDALIIAQTLYDPTDGFAELRAASEFVGSVLGGMNKATVEVSAAHDIAVADVGADFAGHGVELTNISAFDIHPNAKGHKHIFELIKNVVDSAGITAAMGSEDAEAANAPVTNISVSEPETDTSAPVETISETERQSTTETTAPENERDNAADTSAAVVFTAICTAIVLAAMILIPMLIKKSAGHNPRNKKATAHSGRFFIHRV